MQWVYNPYALPLLAAAVLACALAIYAWRRRSVPGAIPFIILVLATAWWSVGYALELSSGNLVWMVRWAKFEYLGITLVPLSWLIFTLRYTKQTRWLEPRTLLLLGIIPAITVTLVWTNELHGLIWREVQRNTLAVYPTLDVTYGPMFWVNLLYAYALLLTGTILIFRIFLQAPLLYPLAREPHLPDRGGAGQPGPDPLLVYPGRLAGGLGAVPLPPAGHPPGGSRSSN